MAGFDLDGPDATGAHIIPFFGHTFNQDTWAPRAGNAYFKVGATTKYFSSEEWLSSFIGHDDNFGPNFCVPRRFLDPNQVKYVVALMPQGTKYDGIRAEVLAINALYNTFHKIHIVENCFWLTQLLTYTSRKDIVLRANVVDKALYVQHLKESMDSYDLKENEDVIEILPEILPDLVWIIEISIPELFSTNYSKLGEIILDATLPLADDLSNQGEAFVLTRFPKHYYLNSGDGKTFQYLPSNFTGHLPVFERH